MKKLYDEAVKIVLDVTGIAANELFVSLKEEYVDARALLVENLSGLGYNDRMIAELTGMSQQRVNSLKNRFSGSKKRKRLEMCDEEIYKRLTMKIQMDN